MFVGPDDDNACGLTTMPLVYGEVCSHVTMHARRQQNPVTNRGDVRLLRLYLWMDSP